MATMTRTPKASGLDRDTRDLYAALNDLVRLYQFRDRDTICCHDISVTQCYALEVLVVDGPQTLNKVAAALMLDKSTASRVVDALVSKGYATRSPHPDDGRAVLLAVTAAGRRLYERIDADLLANVRGVLAAVAPDVRRVIPELLGALLLAAAPRLRGETCCAE